jgi:hypothetical protein
MGPMETSLDGGEPCAHAATSHWTALAHGNFKPVAVKTDPAREYFVVSPARVSWGILHRRTAPSNERNPPPLDSSRWIRETITALHSKPRKDTSAQKPPITSA